jgi:uncharacterized protein (TIGR04255 family)
MGPRKYRNPPIEEAICDFQFAPGLDWDPTLPGRMYGELKETYGEKPRLQQLVEAQLQAGVEGQSSVSMQQKIGKQRVQFLGEGGTRIVGVGVDQLSVHMLRPYKGWEIFRPQILRALEVYRRVAEPEGITRIGLRYINKVTIEEPHDDLSPYFTIPPKFPQIDSTTKLLAFFNRKEAAFSDQPIRIVVTFADMESSPSPSYLLDLDIIWISPEAPVPLDDFPDIMEDMKTRHRKVFEALITDETRKIFDAD